MKYKTVKIGDITSVKGGKRLPKGKNLVSEPTVHPYIRIRDLTQKKLELTKEYEYIDNETQKAISKYTVSSNDIIISIVGTIGLVGIIGETLQGANLTENCAKIINLNKAIIDSEFLYYFLISPSGQAEIKKGTVGAVQPKLPLKNIQAIELPLFPLSVQKRIGALLKSLDDKIELNNRINDNLLQQAMAIFNDRYDSAVEQCPFTSLIHVLGGGTPKTGTPEFWNGDIPFFTPKDVGSPYTFQTEKMITTTGLEHCNSRLYPENTTFVTARGTVGKVSLAGKPMAMNQSCYALASDSIDPILVYFYTLRAVDSLKHKASGAVFDAIVTRDFETEVVSVIPETESKAILALIAPMMKEIHSNAEGNIRLAALRDALLPRLMSGEIDVSSVAL